MSHVLPEVLTVLLGGSRSLSLPFSSSSSISFVNLPYFYLAKLLVYFSSSPESSYGWFFQRTSSISIARKIIP